MKSREHYSPEFRAEAVRLVLEQGPGQAEAARRLGIAKGTLSNWVVAAKGGKDTSAIPGARSVAELEAEVARLRKALAQANMERDIIKTAYFAQESLPVRVDSQPTGPLSHFRYLSCAGGLSCGLLPLAPPSTVTAPTRR